MTWRAFPNHLGVILSWMGILPLTSPAVAEKGETPPGSCQPGAAFLDMTKIFLEPQVTVSPDRHMLLRVSDVGFRQL